MMMSDGIPFSDIQGKLKDLDNKVRTAGLLINDRKTQEIRVGPIYKIYARIGLRN